jgi:hypothetical protein
MDCQGKRKQKTHVQYIDDFTEAKIVETISTALQKHKYFIW